MKIHGLQKMTLLDFPGRVACTVFLGGCDMRCPFCHNAELIDGTAPAVMEEEELLSFLKKRRGLLDGVAITGGEPLLRPDILSLAEKITALGYPLKVDTNGMHPDRLRDLIDRGLVEYVAMDIKNSPEKYAVTCGLETLDLTKIRQSVEILKSGRVDYEFRTTVVAQFHEENDFRLIGQWLRGAKRYFLQSFTDRDSVPYGGMSAPSREEIFRYAQIAQENIPDTQVRGVD